MRSFTDDSYWNLPIPASVPVDSHSTAMTTAQAKSCPPPKIQTPAGAWAMPWSEVADATAPMATIKDKSGATVKIRIDPHVGQMTGDDAAAVFRDWTSGIEVSTFETTFVRKSDGTVDVSKPITCTGFATFGLATNGLAKQVGGPKQNTGHRGVPPSAMALRPDEATTGIFHRLKCSLGPPADHPGPNFPMYGIESPRSGAIPEGAVIRLKASKVQPGNPVQVSARDFGLIVGDTAGPGKSSVKTCIGGVYSSTALKALDNLSWSDWEVMQIGWKVP